MKVKNKFKYTIIASVLALSACVADPAFKAYVIADRLDYDAQAPHYLSLVESTMPSDTAFEKAQKEAIKRRVTQKGILITEAEKHLGIK
jgi:hypothetical protein